VIVLVIAGVCACVLVPGCVIMYIYARVTNVVVFRVNSVHSTF